MSKLRAYGLALACLLVVILAPDLARAAEAVPALAPTLSLPWGQWLIDVLNVASASCVPILVGYLGYLARQYVPALGQVLTNALIDRAVRLAADFALQAIEGAAKGRTVEVKVAPAVIALGAQRAVDSTLPWIIAKAGGPQGIAERVFRHLDIEAGADASNTLAPALDALASGLPAQLTAAIAPARAA